MRDISVPWTSLVISDNLGWSEYLLGLNNRVIGPYSCIKFAEKKCSDPNNTPTNIELELATIGKANMENVHELVAKLAASENKSNEKSMSRLLFIVLKYYLETIQDESLLEDYIDQLSIQFEYPTILYRLSPHAPVGKFGKKHSNIHENLKDVLYDLNQHF